MLIFLRATHLTVCLEPVRPTCKIMIEPAYELNFRLARVNYRAAAAVSLDDVDVGGLGGAGSEPDTGLPGSHSSHQ